MAEPKVYKSPIHKLVKFFEKSRDQWKAKHLASKQENKRLGNKVRRLSVSKNRWKAEALSLRKQLKEASRPLGGDVPDSSEPFKKTERS